MRKIVFPVVSAAILLSVVGCSDSKKGEIKELDLKSEVFAAGDDLREPSYLSASKNHLAVINSSSSDTLVDVYGKDGQYIMSVFPKGEGPGEALWIYSIQFNGKDGFYASDVRKNCLYEVKGLDSRKAEVSTVFRHDNEHNSDSLLVYGLMVKMRSGDIIAANETMKGRMAVFSSDGKLKEMLGQFPSPEILGTNLTEWANVHIYQPMFRGSTDGTFAVSSDDYADILHFVNLRDGKLTVTALENAYPNDLFPLTDGDLVSQLVLTPESNIYTQDLAVSDNHAYVLYIGMNGKDLKETDFYKDTNKYGSGTVKVYDREGNLVKILHLDKWAKSLAVSPDDKYLYTLTESSEDGFSILRYEM